jgi:hypothetical protein
LQIFNVPFSGDGQINGIRLIDVIH